MDQGNSRSEWWARAGAWIESERPQKVIMGLILLNAVVLGLDTSATVTDAIGPLLSAIDTMILGVFTVELALRIGYRRTAFFRNGWNLFDFVVVLIAFGPASEGFLVLRTLRALRLLRLITVMPRLKMVVRALLSSVPGLATIVILQALLFYVAGVMATKMFGEDFPEWFGSLGGSLYSLFQIMTLESWSMGIVRPVMEKFPHAWAFFVPFIVVATFTMLNLVVAVIVNALQTLHEEAVAVKAETAEMEAAAADTMVVDELRSLRAEIAALRRALDERRLTLVDGG